MGVHNLFVAVEPLKMTVTALEPVTLAAPLTARRLRLGLVAHGIAAEDADGAIASFPDQTAREATRIEWEHAAEFDRDYPPDRAGGRRAWSHHRAD